jgi:hypothetical protein
MILIFTLGLNFLNARFIIFDFRAIKVGDFLGKRIYWSDKGQRAILFL